MANEGSCQVYFCWRSILQLCETKVFMKGFFISSPIVLKSSATYITSIIIPLFTDTRAITLFFPEFNWKQNQSCTIPCAVYYHLGCQGFVVVCGTTAMSFLNTTTMSFLIIYGYVIFNYLRVITVLLITYLN